MGKRLFKELPTKEPYLAQVALRQPVLQHRKDGSNATPLGPTFPKPQIIAADPVTTFLHCIGID